MRAALVLGLVLLALPAQAAGKPARPDPDSEARAAFTAGHYADALARYRKLYDDTHHPTYLRNVGRCQQMLKDPDAAIASFREYLRFSPELPATARDEVEGFIRDMQELKRQRADSEAARAPETKAPRIPVPEPERSGVAIDTTRAGFVQAGSSPEPPPPHHTWPWLVGGALVVAAGAVTAVLLLQSPKSACPTCTLPKISIDAR
jgi:hypothetical protein